MKILIANNMAPFVWGGAEELATHLSHHLVEAGHDVELLRIPFQWEPYDVIPSQMLLAHTLDVSEADRVIGLKFPAYLIPHEHKVLWLLHQYRQAYDLFDARMSNIPQDEHGEAVRALITNADNQCFEDCKRIFTNSAVTRDRLKRYNGFDATILYPPVNDPQIFTGGSYDGYVFAGGRVNDMKRQHLLVEAMRHAAPGTRLIVAGPPDTPDDAHRLEKLVESYDLADRVTLDLRFLERETYANYVRHAAAVAYLPYDEDSLGYVAMEGATAKKAILTTPDSGGVQQLVRNGQSGWTVEPHVDALADALSEACADSQRAQELGEASHAHWLSYNISWPSTVEKLLR
jgi:glycosyltransferase involved in cell wall biosynthesis